MPESRTVLPISFGVCSRSWPAGASAPTVRLARGNFASKGSWSLPNALDGPADAGGCVVLSTFQPAADDPTDGAWDAFTKYGKLGPDFGLENVFKCPMILLRPALLPAADPAGMAGAAIPMRELLAPDAAKALEGRGAAVVHWAFGLCVPLA